MEKMPKRDTTGECEGECRDRVFEGEEERQQSIASQPYNEPIPKSPSWTKSLRNNRQFMAAGFRPNNTTNRLRPLSWVG